QPSSRYGVPGSSRHGSLSQTTSPWADLPASQRLPPCASPRAQRPSPRSFQPDGAVWPCSTEPFSRGGAWAAASATAPKYPGIKRSNGKEKCILDMVDRPRRLGTWNLDGYKRDNLKRTPSYLPGVQYQKGEGPGRFPSGARRIAIQVLLLPIGSNEVAVAW